MHMCFVPWLHFLFMNTTRADLGFAATPSWGSQDGDLVHMKALNHVIQTPFLYWDETKTDPQLSSNHLGYEQGSKYVTTNYRLELLYYMAQYSKDISFLCFEALIMITNNTGSSYSFMNTAFCEHHSVIRVVKFDLPKRLPIFYPTL